MWPNEGATSNPNGDSEAKKSDQGCKENKTNLVRKDSKKNFFNSLLTEGLRCGPTRELRLNPTRILKQRNLIKDAKKTKKSGAKKLEKNFFDSLLTTAASDFKKINNEVLGNHNKMNTFLFLRRFFKNPIVITKNK